MYLSNKYLLSDSNNMLGSGYDSRQDRKIPAYVLCLLEAQAPVHSLSLSLFFLF